MAVGTPTNLTAGLNVTDASSFATAAFTPTAGAKLLAWINVGHRTITPNEPTSLTGHGVTWTMVTEVTTSNNTWNCSLWEATASGSPSSGTLTFNLGATAESATWRVIEATGAQIVQFETLATSAANPSLTLDNAIGAGGVTVGILMNNNATTTITPGSGYTDLGSQQSTATAPVFKGAAEYKMAGTTTVDFTASGTVVRALLGVELGPAAAGTQYAASGTVAATGATSGSVALRAVVAGTLAAVTAVMGAVNAAKPASGTIAAVSTTTGAVASRLGATGTTVALSTTTGAVTALLPTTGTTAASSATTGAVTALLPTSGSTDAVSGTSGTVGKLYAADGSVEAVSGTTGAPTALLGAEGSADAVSEVVGEPGARMGVSGTVAAISTTSGSASLIGGPQQYPANGTVTATAGTVGDVRALLTVAGLIEATSDTTGSVGSVYTVAGTVEAVSGTSGDADIQTGTPSEGPVPDIRVVPDRARFTSRPDTPTLVSLAAVSDPSRFTARANTPRHYSEDT